MIGRLADLMAHPRVMIRSEGVDGNGQKITRQQALVDARDHLGSPLLVAVRKSRYGGMDVYDVRSMISCPMPWIVSDTSAGTLSWPPQRM